MIYDTIYSLTAIGLTPGGKIHVQYTFTRIRYTKQQNDTEYSDGDIYNNKNI